jgi:hypothetical protein
VVWGCPEYTKTLEIPTDPYSDTDPTTAELKPGYGMNPYNRFWQTQNRRDMPQIFGGTFGPDTQGTYLRQEQWTRAPERILVADSDQYILGTGDWTADLKWHPYDAGGTPFFDATPRHGRPASGLGPEYKEMSKTVPCLGALYCDGHAVLVSVKEAWDGIRGLK